MTPEDQITLNPLLYGVSNVNTTTEKVFAFSENAFQNVKTK